MTNIYLYIKHTSKSYKLQSYRYGFKLILHACTISREEIKNSHFNLTCNRKNKKKKYTVK